MPKKVTEILSNLFSSNKSPSSAAATTTSRTPATDDDLLECDAAPLDDLYQRSLAAKSEVDKITTTLTQTSLSPTTTTTTTGTGGRRPSASASLTTAAEAAAADQPSPIAIASSNQLRRQNSAPVTGNSNSPAQSLTRSATSPDTNKWLEPHQMPGLDIVLPSQQQQQPQQPQQPVCVNNTQGYNVYQFSQISGLHIGSVYNIASQGQPVEGKAGESARPATADGPMDGGPSAYRKTKTVDAMMRSKARLQHRHMDIVSTHLGEGWRDIIRLLGFSEGQIEQMYEDNFARGIKEVIYNFLLDYTRNDEQASVGHLTRLLWKAGRRECVVLLKEYWKGTRDAFDGDESMSSLKEETDESVS